MRLGRGQSGVWENWRQGAGGNTLNTCMKFSTRQIKYNQKNN